MPRVSTVISSVDNINNIEDVGDESRDMVVLQSEVRVQIAGSIGCQLSVLLI